VIERRRSLVAKATARLVSLKRHSPPGSSALRFERRQRLPSSWGCRRFSDTSRAAASAASLPGKPNGRVAVTPAVRCRAARGAGIRPAVILNGAADRTPTIILSEAANGREVEACPERSRRGSAFPDLNRNADPSTPAAAPPPLRMTDTGRRAPRSLRTTDTGRRAPPPHRMTGAGSMYRRRFSDTSRAAASAASNR
jgi:hypothetical protein